MAGPCISLVPVCILLSISLLPVLSARYVNSELPTILSHTPLLIRRVYEPKTLYPHTHYIPQGTIPFHGKSKTTNGEVVGKFHGGVFKGKYWSKHFSGTLRKNHGGRALSDRYEGNKSLYQGQVMGRLKDRGWYRGLYKTYSKITYYRGSLQPKAPKPRRYNAINRKPVWPVQRIYSPFSAYTGYYSGLNKYPRSPFRFYKKFTNYPRYTGNRFSTFRSISAHSRKLPYPAYVPKRNGTPKIPQITLVAKKHRLKKQFKRNYLRKGSKFPTLKVSQVKIRKLKRNKSKKKPRRGKKGKSSKSRREFIRKFAKKLERTRKEAKQKAVLKRVISI
eukprot:XP_011422050.1 PREDICTED: uncharacterized protein LOC105324623 [Crassostrea gigas]